MLSNINDYPGLIRIEVPSWTPGEWVGVYRGLCNTKDREVLYGLQDLGRLADTWATTYLDLLIQPKGVYWYRPEFVRDHGASIEGFFNLLEAHNVEYRVIKKRRINRQTIIYTDKYQVALEVE